MPELLGVDGVVSGAAVAVDMKAEVAVGGRDWFAGPMAVCESVLKGRGTRLGRG